MDAYIRALDVLIRIYVVVLGLVIGSFVNVLIYRIPLKIPFYKGASFCPNCKHKLNWLDLFPVFSYIFLGGKCRYCKQKISPRYPLLELLHGACYYLIYTVYGFSVQSLLFAVACSCLIALAWIDIDHQIIPDRFPILIVACGIVLLCFPQDISWLDKVIGLFAISVPLYLVSLFTGGMGEGDVKLFAACGFLLGWKLILLTMLFASISAALYGSILMLLKKAKGKTAIPFGPFIALGTMLCILWGNQILGWYLSLL